MTYSKEEMVKCQGKNDEFKGRLYKFMFIAACSNEWLSIRDPELNVQ
jgi:hypothetical protein